MAAPGNQQPPATGGAHSHHGRPAAPCIPVPEGASAVLWKPDLEQLPLVVEACGAKFPNTGMGNYHALVAQWLEGPVAEARIRYRYQFGKPSGHSPRELLAAAKTALEILPDPLPREHYRYHSAESWGFKVHFREAPLAGARVRLETANGSRLEAQTDAQGRVAFDLPDDFPEVKPGRNATPPTDFSLSVAHGSGREQFHTVLLAQYHPGPHHWQSTGWGLGAVAMGLVAGLAASRRGNGPKDQERGQA